MIWKWFKDFEKYCKKRGFEDKFYKIINFDELGFRIGIMKGEIVFVLENAFNIYFKLFENRK